MTVASQLRKTEREEARERLLEWIKPGDRIYCVLRHVSSSGMLRVIQLIKFEADRPLHIGYNAALAMDDRYDRDREGIRVGGAGMDMGFHLVYNLGRTLWPNGYRCSGKGCHSNDHANGPHYTPDGRMKHRDGGYALKSVWL
jgi:hypothetical protein